METRSRKKFATEAADLQSSIKGNSIQQAIQNPMILETIFAHCSMETLKDCRLVSKEWYDLALTQWRSRAILKIECVQGKVPLHYQQFFGNPHKNWTQPFASMMKFETRPYRRLRVVGHFLSGKIHGRYLLTYLAHPLHELDLNCSVKTKYWRKLIFKLTPNLKKLTLGDKYSDGKEDLKFMAVHQQQNLKRLEVKGSKFYFLPVSWDAFLSTFTKLEVIVLSVANTVNHKFSITFAEYLNAVKKVKSRNPDCLPVHLLDIISRGICAGKFIPESIPKLLHDVKFPLKTLKIDIRNKTTEVVLQQLLNLYSDTLESLVIIKGRPGLGPSFVSPFTELMKSLKSLEILGPILKDMSSLQYTPNLEKLSICEVTLSEYTSHLETRDVRDLSKFPSSTKMVDKVIEDVQLNKLREFNAYFTLRKATTVKILGNWMPNLEKLRVRVTSGDGFGEMCRQWGNTLRELVLGSRSFLVDEDITGFATGEKTDERNRAPNVTLLKNLQIFRMEEYICSKGKPRIMRYGERLNETENVCIKKFSKITDHSVHHGFLGLAHLHTLELQSSETMKVKTRNLLKMKGIHVTVRIRQACKCPRPRHPNMKEMRMYEFLARRDRRGRVVGRRIY